MTAPTLVAEPLWLASVDLDVDMERVPACEGFVDPEHLRPCPRPALYVIQLVHLRNVESCATALACEAHKQIQLDIQRRVEAASPGHMALCPTHLLPIDTKAVPL